jgi:hypothetical protein
MLCALAKHGTLRFSALRGRIEDISLRMLVIPKHHGHRRAETRMLDAWSASAPSR